MASHVPHADQPLPLPVAGPAEACDPPPCAPRLASGAALPRHHAAADSARAEAIAQSLVDHFVSSHDGGASLQRLRHLHRSLLATGLQVFGQLPTAELIGIGQELATLPTSALDGALQDLMNALLHEMSSRMPPEDQFLSTFMSDQRLQVSEASPSAFMRASGQDELQG